MAYDERFRLDDGTIATGRAHIEKIRAQLNPGQPSRGPSERQQSETPPTPAVAAPTSEPDWSPDRISAELAAGAERDWLAARVEALEQEVAQLRAALASVLAAAADGLQAQPAPATAATTTAGTATAEGTDEPNGRT